MTASRATSDAAVRAPRDDLVGFVVLAYGISWAIWSPLVLAELGLLAWEPPPWWHLLGASGPALAAVTASWLSGRAAGVLALARSVLRFRGPPGLLLFALLFAPAAFLGASLASWAAGGAVDLGDFGRLEEIAGWSGIAGWSAWILTFGFGEETGWRGYAQPVLERSRSPRSASVIVGVVWAGWHAPLFVYRYEPSPFGAFGFSIGIVAGSVLLAWLYSASGAGVVAPALWHGGYNAAVADASAGVAILVTGAVVFLAVSLVRAGGPRLRDPWPGWNLAAAPVPADASGAVQHRRRR